MRFWRMFSLWLIVFLFIGGSTAIGQLSGHTVTLVDVTYSGGNTTFTYHVYSHPDTHAISHWTLAWCNPELIIDATQPWVYTLDDPTTGAKGIKFDSGVPEGETWTFFVTLLGIWPAGNSTATLKFGQNGVEILSVQGPICGDLGSIGDTVFEDVNGNGTQDGEPGIAGVQVKPLLGGTQVGLATTDGNGNYTFSNLGAGNYTVNVVDATVPAGMVLTTGNDPMSVNLPAGVNFVDADFGYQRPAPAIHVEKSTNGQDADSSPGPYIPVSDPVTWTYVVTNTGGVTLTNIQVTDDQLGLIGTIASLAPTAQATLTASGTASVGQYSNLATAEGTAPDQSTVTDTDPSHYFGMISTIDVEKATNGDDADSPTGPYIPVSDPVNWTYVVTNTGNVPLTNVTLNDDKEGPITLTTTTLAPGEQAYGTASSTAEAGQYRNTATATGKNPNQNDVTDTDPSNYFGVIATIDLEKATNGSDADESPGIYIPVGTPVTWTYVVTNTGNVTLTNLTLNDDKEGPITLDKTTLAPGEQATGTASGTAVLGEYSNTATVTGTPSGLTVAGQNSVMAIDPVQTLTDTDPSNYFGYTAGLTVVKKTNGEDANTPPGPSIPVGDPVTWTYEVTNTSNVTLTDIVVTDDHLGYIGTIASLAPGATTTLTAPAGTAVAGQYDNVGTATGKDPNQNDVTASDPSHYFGFSQTPSIQIEKSTNGHDADLPNGPNIPAGDPVTWTYVVTNTCTVTLTDVTVVDDKVGAISLNKTTLAPGEQATGTANGTAGVGLYSNLATVTAMDPQGYPVTDNDPSHYFGTIASIDIEKSTNGEDADLPPGPKIRLLDMVIWNFVVTNTGNVPLTNVAVVDDKLGPITLGKTTLAPGESTNGLASGPADANQYTNLGTVTALDPEQKTVTDSDPSHYWGIVSTIDVIKYTNGFDADAPTGPRVMVGDPITWKYVITNWGNQILTDITLVDDKVGMIALPTTTLAPGESMTAFAYGVAVEGQYANMATVTALDPSRKTITGRDPSHYLAVRAFVPAGEGPRRLLARYQPWYGGADSDSTLRHWAFDYSGGYADSSLFEHYDSYDPEMLAEQILLAWACGIDGFVVDWYGEESYENPSLRGLLQISELLYNAYHDRGFNFEIAVSYNENAHGELDENFIYLRDSVFTHPSYWGFRRGYSRPLFLFNQEEMLITPEEYRTCADTILPADVFLLWNGTESDAFDFVDVCYPWVQPLNGMWDPLGMEWGATYLDTTYWRMNFLPEPGDLLFALGGTWPGFNDKFYAHGLDHWMDRQDTLVYHWTWEKVHEYDLPLEMPWCLIETWNDWNQATQIEPSVEYDYKFNVLTRDNARRFKWSVNPDSVGVENLGLLVPQHILQARIAAHLRPEDEGTINALLIQALNQFFYREYLEALSLADQAAGIAPNPITIVNAGESHVEISWDPSTHANSYNVYYSTDSTHFEPCAFQKPNVVNVGDVTEYTITGLDPDKDYYIAITAVNTDLGPYANESWYENTITGAEIIRKVSWIASAVPENPQNIPTQFFLSQNYPNPFNPTTTINYALPVQQHVKLIIYDIQGRVVDTLVDEMHAAGFYSIEFDARHLASGVYIYSIVTEKYTKIRKLMLLK